MEHVTKLERVIKLVTPLLVLNGIAIIMSHIPCTSTLDVSDASGEAVDVDKERNNDSE